LAIMKMCMVNIVGPINDFERIALNYVAESNIHTENVFSVLDNVKGMYAYNEDSRVFEIEEQALSLLELAGINETEISETDSYKEFEKDAPRNMGCILNGLNSVKESIASLTEDRKRMYAKLQEYDELRKQLRPIETADIDLNRLYEFEFIKFRFGKMPIKSYRILYEYLEGINTFFLKASEDEEYVWGVYFVPKNGEEKADAILSSLYFERVRISNNVHGTPKNSLDYLDGREKYRKGRIEQIDSEIKELLKVKAEFIVYAKNFSQRMIKLQQVKKVAGHTKESFYIVGWMAAKDADKLEKNLVNEAQLVFLTEEPKDVSKITPPTKLKNFILFRPFEMFVNMYGTPAYNEFDPTWIFAISYFIMFGMMFGDVGQGLLLVIGGFLIAKLKKSRLGAIIGLVGISSMVFGAFYGSVFGNEEIIHGYNPMENMMDMLMYAVYLGVGVLLFVMLVNILIGIKNRDIRKALLSQNGLAGLVFYSLTVFTVVSVMLKGEAASKPIIYTIIAMILVIMIQEPVSRLLKRKKNWMPEKKGMFITEAFFEAFEIVLSFVTNTLSFIRVGAFALIHVGMMGVVKILAQMMGGMDSPSIVVIILGNILVIGLEGLVVGIQTLRLEFFEMFNRFYSGSGREFRSLNEDKY